MSNDSLERLFALALASTAALAGCDWNSVTTGDHGVVEFVPDHCGHDRGCDLDDALIVGGELEVNMSAADDRASVGGLRMISDNPAVLWVGEGEWSTSYDSDWRVIGVGEGWAELVVIDQFGHEVDHTDVHVQFADRLGLESRGTNALRLAPRPGYAEVWSVMAGAPVSLEVAPRRTGDRLMGSFEYDVVIDPTLYAALDPSAKLTRGELRFHAPAGEHVVDFTAVDGTSVSVLIVAQ
jgi:hypothetical protein